MIRRFAAVLVLATLPCAGAAVVNVILVMTDGLRVQEVFRGPEAWLARELSGGKP